MAEDRLDTDIATKSKALLAVMDGVLGDTSLDSSDSVGTALRNANFKSLYAEWDTLLRAQPERTDEIQSYADEVRDKLLDLLLLREGGRNGGRRRKYTRRYCTKTPCRRMGFTQRASCRPYKNCYRSTRS